MISIFSALVGQLIEPKPKRPGTGAERQRRYKARYIALYGKEAWDARARENRKKFRENDARTPCKD